MNLLDVEDKLVILEENNNTLKINNNKLEAILSLQPSNSMLNLSEILPNQPEKVLCKIFKFIESKY